jgi:hypothetical protein
MREELQGTLLPQASVNKGVRWRALRACLKLGSEPPAERRDVEYRNELIEEGIGKLVYVRAMGTSEGPDQEQLQGLIEDPSKAFSAPLRTATWLARLDGYDAVGVRFRIPRDAPPEQQTRGYFVPWSAIFHLEMAED